MLPQRVRQVLGLIATLLFGVFIFGLSHSSSTGFAGFWGGLPFEIIAVTVVGMACYDLWDETIRKQD